MKWSDVQFRPAPKILRQFAGAWLVFLSAWGAYQWGLHGNRTAGLVSCCLALLVGGVGLVAPRAIRWLFVLCMIMAFPIGWLVSQTMLALMFYGVITPFALVFRFVGRDALRRRPSPTTKSFWLVKEQPKDLKSYLRQY
jgi:hypothetical protein